MDFEKKVADIASGLFASGWAEEQVAEALRKSIKKAIDDQFSYGGVGYKKIKEVVEQSVEKSVSSFEPKYIPKTEIVLAEIIEQTLVAEKRRLLENFRIFMTDSDMPEQKNGHRRISLDKIFEAYRNYVAKNFDTEDRNIDYDDEPTYYPVECKAWIEPEREEIGHFWSNYKHATLYLVTEDGQDEHGEKCNFKIPLIMWDEKDGWRIYELPTIDFARLAYEDPMLVYLYKLKHSYVCIKDTGEEFEDYVNLEARPECDWN